MGFLNIFTPSIEWYYKKEYSLSHYVVIFYRVWSWWFLCSHWKIFTGLYLLFPISNSYSIYFLGKFVHFFPTIYNHIISFDFFWCLMSSCWKFYSVCNLCSLVKVSFDVVNLYIDLYVNSYSSKKLAKRNM